MYDDSAMVVYLFSSINRISDYSFFRVALRYFIEKRNIEEYWGYFYKIAHKYKNELFADVLTESLMDLRRYSGSCQKLYEKIDDTWNTYQENFPEIFVCITNNLNNKYLNSKYLGPNGKWKDDIYAKLLKAFINSTEYPPLPAILTEAWSKLENNKNREIYIRKLFKNRKWEKDTMHLDEISKNNYLITIGCVIFYQDTYGVKKEEITGNDPPVQLRNIINEYLYPDYYKCVYYKLKAA
jgi:hypothetical protein